MSMAAQKTLTLTGTLMGGYSSNLFYLMQRFGNQLRGEFAYHDEARWIQQYGFEQTTRKREPKTRYNTHSRGFKSPSTKEIPGLSPLALPFILANSSFIRVADVTDDLPPYKETVRLIDLDETEQEPGLSHKSAYNALQSEFAEVIRKTGAGSSRLQSTYNHALLAYPDNPPAGENVYDEEGDLVASSPSLRTDLTYPKEAELIRIVREQRKRGFPTLVLVNYTARRDVTPRLTEAITGANLSARTLRGGDAKNREARIERWVSEGIDAVFAHPGLIQTGLDLVDFPTIVWYQPTYSTYTMRQASRRSWRIGQENDVEIIHLIYAGTMQETALNLIARKAQASMAVEGELPEEGLAAYGDVEDNLHLALARSLIEPGKASGSMNEDLQRLIDLTGKKDADDAAMLVTDAWSAIEMFIPEEDRRPEEKPEPRPKMTRMDLSVFTDLDSGLGTEQNPSLFSALLK